MSQEEMAKRLGYERSMISRIEKGEINLSGTKINAIAEVLGVSVAELMGIKSTGEMSLDEIICKLGDLDNNALDRVISYAEGLKMGRNK